MHREDVVGGMEIENGKGRRSTKAVIRNMVVTVVIACVMNGALWIGIHGCPLVGLPEKEDVERVTIVRNGTEEREIVDEKDVELLVQAAHLLNYRIGGEAEGEPVIVVTYELKNGESVSVGANGSTMWWKGKGHALKEEDVFVNIVEGLFFGEYQ